MISQPTLSNAGTWVPVTDPVALATGFNGQLANTFHSIIDLNGNGHYGLVSIGWAFSGWPSSLNVPARVNLSILAPDGSGGLSVQTSSLVANPYTNGGGSMVVADFNRDNKPDIFVAAHNESPFVPTASTAFLSNSAGTFTRVEINDSVAAHDAQLFSRNGTPAIMASTYAGDKMPVYYYQDGGFVRIESDWNANWQARAGTSVVGNFGPNNSLAVVRGDVNDESAIGIYAFDGTDITSATPLQKITPYLSTLPEYQNYVSYMGPGSTHTYRVWKDDINHDGYDDILAGGSMWSSGSTDFPTALQLLLNNGNGFFVDKTASYSPLLNMRGSEIGYTPTFIDLDNSGIDTYLFDGSMSWGSFSRQSDFVLLNDGTGHLYVALHDEFFSLARDVYSFLDKPVWTSSTPPRFIGIPQPNGEINFIAEVPSLARDQTTGRDIFAIQYVNVPLQYNPSLDFKESITVSDRNHSTKMRSWAGDDKFYDVNANTHLAATLDGGLGLDSSSYSNSHNTYSVSLSNGDIRIRHTAINDTLKNIEVLNFADASIETAWFSKTDALTASQSDSLVELYIASFNRAPDAIGLNYWGGRLYDGMTLPEIAKSFFVQPETVAAYPSSMPTRTFVSTVYNNVLSRAPDTAGLNYWLREIDTGNISKDVFLLAIINGAKASTGSAIDRETLANKVAVGNYFAFDKGINNNTWGIEVMDSVTSVASTVTAANALTDSYSAAIATGASSSSAMLLGVADIEVINQVAVML